MTDTATPASTGDNGSAAPIASSAAPAGQPATASVDTNSWMGTDQDTIGFVQNKGWKAPTEVIQSYRNLEKLVGLPPEKIIKMPSDDKPESWNQIYDKLGRPADPKGYQWEAGEQAVDEWARKNFHELGLTKKQGEEIMSRWNAMNKERMDGMTKDYQQKAEVAEKALRKEWGAAHDQNIDVAKNAARKLGFSPEAINALEKTMGYDGVMKFMHGLGSKLGEANFVSSGETQGFNGMMTPAAAKNRINQLRGDPEFTRRYINGGAQERAEMERLHAMAYHE